MYLARKVISIALCIGGLACFPLAFYFTITDPVPSGSMPHLFPMLGLAMILIVVAVVVAPRGRPLTRLPAPGANFDAGPARNAKNWRLGQ
jgi:hypothetical protein